MARRESVSTKIACTIGAFLQLFLVALPKDLWRWLNLRRKCVRGQVVVVTGGASGLGRQVAEEFADPKTLGARVAIIDTNMEGAEEVVEGIRERGGVAKAWKCDISDASAMQGCANSIRSELGHVDIVVCNAAVLYFGHTLDLRTEQLQNAVNVNIMGTINTIRAFIGPMMTENRGQIVAVSSIAGFIGETFGMSYCPTKFAVRGVMECLRMELRDKCLGGIACTTICPFFIRTPMILDQGIRPVSRFISFMSVERCAALMMDAILKEKVLAFVPTWTCIVPIIYSLFSLNMQRVARDFMNFRYEPVADDERGDQATKAATPLLTGQNDSTTDRSKRIPATDQKRRRSSASSSHLAFTPIMEEEESAERENDWEQLSSTFGASSLTLMEEDSCEISADTPSPILGSSKLELPRNAMAMESRFESPRPKWFVVIPFGLLITFLAWYSPEFVKFCALKLTWTLQTFLLGWLYYLFYFTYYLAINYRTLIVSINICAWLAHFGEAVYSLYICDELHYSHLCALKWFLQTLLLGFPSLRLLIKHRYEARKRRSTRMKDSK